MKIDITEQEANELIKLIDFAVKFQGLSVAASAQFFFDKIKKSFESSKEESNNNTQTQGE